MNKINLASIKPECAGQCRYDIRLRGIIVCFNILDLSISNATFVRVNRLI